jgi:hypothetical protein
LLKTSETLVLPFWKIMPHDEVNSVILPP